MLSLTFATCAALFVCVVVVVVVLVPPLALIEPEDDVAVPTLDVWEPLFVAVVDVLLPVLPLDVPPVVELELELPVDDATGVLDVVSTGEEVDVADVVVPVLPTEVAETEQLIWLPAKFVV